MSAPHRSDLSVVEKVPPARTSSQQYDLFTTFYGDIAELSNTIELWDAIPKYAVSARKQVSLRDEKGRLSVYRQEFKYRPSGRTSRYLTVEMRLQPASVEVNGVDRDFYPSANEEIMEEVLRKVFSDQQYGLHEERNLESWVTFTLYVVRQELKARGHTRSLQEIKRTLEIMGRCNIEVSIKDGQGKKTVYSAPILGDMLCNGRDSYLADPKSKWAARLPALVSRSINQIDYRQYNYGRQMRLKSPLARWLHKRLSHNYVNANIMRPYHISYESIERDSGMLLHSKYDRNLKTVHSAWEELVEDGAIRWYKEDLSAEGEGLVFEIIPTVDFEKEIVTANARQRDHRAIAGDPEAKKKVQIANGRRAREAAKYGENA